MSEHNDGGPAWPSGYVSIGDGDSQAFTPGMTLRAYAAIKLRVPDSGIDWLDAMILQAKRDDFAGQALNAAFSSQWDADMTVNANARVSAAWAYAIADAMLATRKGGM